MTQSRRYAECIPSAKSAITQTHVPFVQRIPKYVLK